MAAVLLDHHPTFRSETGPMTGCRCGGVGLGQSVTLHVAAALAAALDGGQPDRGPQCASEHPAGWRCEHRAGHSDTTEDQHRNGGVVWGGGDRG